MRGVQADGGSAKVEFAWHDDRAKSLIAETGPGKGDKELIMKFSFQKDAMADTETDKPQAPTANTRGHSS